MTEGETPEHVYTNVNVSETTNFVFVTMRCLVLSKVKS